MEKNINSFEKMTKIIGIDFGTSNTTAAVVINGKPVIIPNDIGEETTPSVVSINQENKEVLVGEAARKRALLNPLETIFSVKRLLGVSYKEIEHLVHYLPYELKKGKKDEVLIKIGKREYTAIEISALIFENVKKNAEAFLKSEVSEAVVTVPAYYNHLQRKAIQDAAEMAGWKVKRIINEPTAAALAVKYFFLYPAAEMKIAIVHLGGGTVDVTTLEVGDGIYEVKSTSGNTLMGGDEIDNKIQSWAKEELLKLQNNIDFETPEFKSYLKWECEKAKCALSSQNSFALGFPCIRKKERNAYISETIVLTTETLNALQEYYLNNVLETTKRCVNDSGFDISHYSVILVGQQSLNTFIKNSVVELFNNRTIKNIDPALIVAKGAAIHAGILMGEIINLLLLDVTPLNLGIETLGGVMTTLIPANCTIPTRKDENFSTTADNQTSVEIHVLQGQRPMANQNKTIGRFHLDGIPPAPRGVPQVEVTFDLDENGILNVSAKDKASGKGISVRYE